MSKEQKKQQQQRKNQVESAPGQEDKKLKGPNRPST
ncbi:spore protein [Sutcliffiella horikoshii]|nr:spore protein [Sutcliffiella horikoshii]MCM3617325.1 spore protein [Sutcliffiella horikoshii]